MFGTCSKNLQFCLIILLNIKSNGDHDDYNNNYFIIMIIIINVIINQLVVLVN